MTYITLPSAPSSDLTEISFNSPHKVLLNYVVYNNIKTLFISYNLNHKYIYGYDRDENCVFRYIVPNHILKISYNIIQNRNIVKFTFIK